MQPLMVRLPDEVLEWVREKAALETIRLKKQVSMNSLVVEILEREMVENTRKEMIKSLTGNQCQGYG